MSSGRIEKLQNSELIAYVRVLHCSDFHLLPQIGSVPLSDWLSKRATGALNYWWERRGQFELTPEKLRQPA